MESPRKFNDCYFYYYSTCTKGDNCVFRHEPSALGCETMCTAWQQGKCLDKRCKLRHMELRKNRKQIPCYWENQPGGCRKKHCPFMHKNPDARTDGIAPSQPAPPQPACSVGVGVVTCGEAVPVGVPGGVPGVGGVGGVGGSEGSVGVAAPAPMLWQHQQQRQVVLDSAILGVLPSAELVPHPRRPHEAYPLPVDPLVVNFEEESDNESAPSSTPTKRASPGEGVTASLRSRSRSRSRSPRQELALLERIQAEAAALYGYSAPAALPPRPYERLSLDDLAGKKAPQHTERRKSLDFKILSLEEIRARKKVDAIVPPVPITLNLSRKRKLSTRETVTSAGNKIIKVVRSNSVVYKKVEPETPPVEAKMQRQLSESSESRKRTLSEASSCDIYDLHEDELLDDCQEFKRIKIAERTFKPRLIRNRPAVVTHDAVSDAPADASDKKDDDSDSEVQIVSVNIVETNVELSDSEIIDVDSARIAEPVQVVDLSDDEDVTLTNVPDVVASCRKKSDAPEKDLLKDIDSILNGDDSNIEEL